MPEDSERSTGGDRESFSVEQLLVALREAEDRNLTDEQVALFASIFVEQHSPLPLNEDTLATAMWMLAARRVSSERAEMLLVQLEESGDVEEDA